MQTCTQMAAMIVLGAAVLARVDAAEPVGSPVDDSDTTALTYLFGDTLINADGETVPFSRLAGRKIGVLFSTEACPTCISFIPTLIEAYQDLREAGRAFEIVFVSADRDAEQMLLHMRNNRMPWPAMSYRSEQTRELQDHFNVRRLPALVIIDSTGKILSIRGRSEIVCGSVRAYETWAGGAD